MEEGRGVFKILICKSTGKRLLRKRKRIFEDITIGFKEIGVNTRNWIDSLLIGIIGEPFESPGRKSCLIS